MKQTITTQPSLQQQTSYIQNLRNSKGLVLQDAFSESGFNQIIEEYIPTYRERIFSPATTILAFMSQTMCADHSCQQTVSRVNAERLAHQLPLASPNTGAYCRARERLPEGLLHALAKSSGSSLNDLASKRWLWKSRVVKLVDGSTVSMPDTEMNQLEYPQQFGQQEGLGFPISRIVGVLSLCTGAILDLSIGPYKGKQTGEHGLLRQLFSCFDTGDVVLADAYYCSYFLIALLQMKGVDIVCRLHGARDCDFRKGKQLGKQDHLVIYKKPKKPEWMEPELYNVIPETMSIRETKVNLDIPGYRVKSYVVVTTLIENKMYSKKDLKEIYYRRWSIELDLRNIKVTMQMEILRCQTPSMIRKEIWAHVLSYNLVRKVMLDAAIKYGVHPREISFKHTQQTLNAYRNLWVLNTKLKEREVYDSLLQTIIQIRVANRPGRIEPRAKKRRPKQLNRLMAPRAIVRENILRNRTP